jgi:hypothetical protein
MSVFKDNQSFLSYDRDPYGELKIKLWRLNEKFPRRIYKPEGNLSIEVITMIRLFELTPYYSGREKFHLFKNISI